MNNMIKAAFITQHDGWAWQRQLPSGSSSFQGVEFFVPIDEADIVFVYDALPKLKVNIPQGTPTVFICSEPQNVKRYSPKFLKQFDAVITTDREVDHPNPIFVQAGLPWQIGCYSGGGKFPEHPLSYEELEKHAPAKRKLVSVVSSDKAFTEEHRARLQFVSQLKDALGDQVDVFGRGIVDFVDKREVLDDYRYHIALENCAIEDYWTEKIADPFLSLTYPIYHGCPNIGEYFLKRSFQAINIYKPEEAIQTIKEVIASDLAEENQDELLNARKLVMQKHNLFSLLARVSRDNLTLQQGCSTTGLRKLYDEIRFLPLRQKMKHRVLQIANKFPLLLKVRACALKLRDALKYKLAVYKRKLKFYWNYTTDSFYRSHQKYIRQNPNEKRRYDYDLPLGAKIIDAGGYDGNFVHECLTRFDAQVTVFEPVETFATKIRQRFAGDSRVSVYAAGLSDRDETVEFHLDGDAPGLFCTSSDHIEKVNLWDIERFIHESAVEEWDLIKLNIEGGEYTVLKKLIDSDLILKFRFIQVQFHLNVPEARKYYKLITKQLRKTHSRQWRYLFIWESWERRCNIRFEA